MDSKQNNNSKSKLENEIDKLGDMLDVMLAKGDDAYYEATKSYREEQKKEQVSKSRHRRSKRM